MFVMEITNTTDRETSALLLTNAKIISEQNKQIDEKDRTISFLSHQIRLLKQERYGRRSEKIDPKEFGQESLFNEAELESCTEATEEPEEKTTNVSGHQRKKRGHRPLPEDLPRVRKEYSLSSDEKTCVCGCEMTCIGEEVLEQLDIVPAKIQVIKHARKKYVCKACSKEKENGKTENPVPIKIAQRPEEIIPKSIAAPSLLANIATAKFCDHLPLYRQESIFKRINSIPPTNPAYDSTPPL
jgi:transposase